MSQLGNSLHTLSVDKTETKLKKNRHFNSVLFSIYYIGFGRKLKVRGQTDLRGFIK